MRTPSRLAFVAAFAACLPLLALAGCGDEPPTYMPLEGTWSYAELSVVSNTCGDDYLVNPPSTFYIDYDGGNTFDIELGENDVTCTVSGVEFSCTAYVVTFEILALAATGRLSTTWSGSFSSEREAEGTSVLQVTCTGEDCSLITTLPCSRTVSFRAMKL
jgi:hypothetical protein